MVALFTTSGVLCLVTLVCDFLVMSSQCSVQYAYTAVDGRLVRPQAFRWQTRSVARKHKNSRRLICRTTAAGPLCPVGRMPVAIYVIPFTDMEIG